MDDYCAARSGPTPPLPWPTFSPPFSELLTREVIDWQTGEVIVLALEADLQADQTDSPTGKDAWRSEIEYATRAVRHTPPLR